MFIIDNRQLNVLVKKMREDYQNKIVKRINEGFPELKMKYKEDYYPLIHHIINISLIWKIKTDDNLVKCIYLILTHDVDFLTKKDPHIGKLMTWPGRNENDKIEYLHHYLINKHYVINAS
jgi:hypothetical protein